MGMFDYVAYTCDCPNCGKPLSGFQSKDGPCHLLSLKPTEVSHWYTSCDHCNHWVEYAWPPPVPPLVPLLVKNEPPGGD